MASNNSIQISGEAFLVRENLWKALTHIRLATENQTLWIDAICIDQQNIQERNHQVEIMGEVYGKATLVIVWLGTLLERESAKRLFTALTRAQKTGDWLDPSERHKGEIDIEPRFYESQN